MARPRRRRRRSYGGHYVAWDDTLHKVTVYPMHPNASKTIHFGLGNAVIVLNLSNLPEKIVSRITGETTKNGITPTSPFKLRRWFAAPVSMQNRTVEIEGFDGFSKKITFQEAGGCSVKEVSSVGIIQNGYGSEKIVPRPGRLGW